MKKKMLMISGIAGMIVLGLCIKFSAGSRKMPAVENAAVAGRIVSEEGIWPEAVPSGQEPAQQDKQEPTEWEQDKQELTEWEQVKQDKTAIPEIIHFAEPIVKLNGEEGELWYDWDDNSIRVDEETLLLVSKCYFPEENRQQKIFFLIKAPDFIPREVFRQDDKDRGVSDPLEWEEYRMERPHLVDGGYVYEVDGVLYFLDENFKEASLLCDLCGLLGDFYTFSPSTFRTCDITEDAARMLICTDEGLYEYCLESGERRLLEPAFFARCEAVPVEGDCLCGVRDFEFSGPVMTAYAPDGLSYAFLTGTEEADWGDITGAVLRSKDGKTLYEREAELIYDYKWIEEEEADYFVVFYEEDKSEKLDRVDVNTGETVTFEMPGETYISPWDVSFLDADRMFYLNYDKPDDDKNIFEIYRLSSGERQDFEVTGKAEWEMLILDQGGWCTKPVKYPKVPAEV